MNREHLAKLGFIFLLWYITFRAGQTLHGIILDYMQFAPNCFRLWDQALICLHDRPFSYITLATSVWVLSILGTWFLIRPDEMDTLALIIGTVSASLYFYVRQAPQYLLLSVMVISGNPVFLFLLVPVKEYAAIVGVLYLFVYRRESIRYRTILWIVLAGLLYLGIRQIIGFVPYAPGDVQPVTLWYVLAQLPVLMEYILLRCVSILIMLVLVARDRRDVLFLFLCGVFVFMFALFWEVQLWLVPAVVIMAERRGLKNE